MSNADLIAITEDDGLSKKLTTATTDYIYSLESIIDSIIIDFEGENLPTIGENDITSDIPYTFNRDIDTTERQRVTLGLNTSVNAVNISFTFAGQEYVCHIYRGATIEGIAYGPNTPVQPPITETWTGDTTARVYLLVQKEGEIVIRPNWQVPPQIASTEVVVQESDDNYSARITPVANPPAGNYVIKYCGQPLINVTVN